MAQIKHPHSIIHDLCRENGLILPKGVAAEIFKVTGSTETEAVVNTARLLMAQARQDWTLPKPGMPRTTPEFRRAVDHFSSLILSMLPSLREDALDWIVRSAVNGKHFKSVTIDSGYDISLVPKPTGRGYRICDYQTVEDFLYEPNGQSVATFERGSGFSCESLFDEFDRDINEWVFDLINDALAAAKSGQAEALGHLDTETCSWLRALDPKGDQYWHLRSEIFEAMNNSADPFSVVVGDTLQRPFSEVVLMLRPDLQARIELQRQEAEAEQQQAARWIEAVASFHHFFRALARDYASLARRQADPASLTDRKFNAEDALSLIHLLGSCATTNYNARIVSDYTQGNDFSRISTKSLRKQIALIREEVWENPAFLDNLSLFESEVPGGLFPGSARSAFARVFGWLDQDRFVNNTQYYVTVIWPAGSMTPAMTFANDNWEWFRLTALRVETDSIVQAGRISVIVRRFEPLNDPASGLPYKSIGGALCDGHSLIGIPGHLIQESSRINPHTGARLEPEPAASYKDFNLIVRLPDAEPAENMYLDYSRAKLAKPNATPRKSVARRRIITRNKV